MDRNIDNNVDNNIIQTEYLELMQKSYIDYAMSVIIARALPDVRDGLKPVQRRTLYDMHGSGSVSFDRNKITMSIDKRHALFEVLCQNNHRIID